ncbi:hypothetical protein [Bradyrhizobium sp. BWA-3-5]|uniref:hypothetical protein n=1 Tax=Bradyrhizobium sp. BWA-3-5 TaxID=3080013 RepID=UPI00293EDC1F|nr:hypothetical protein [Bradyrhizobium sp. BWA-3-5]WOH64095.1 hypothetical protein RX331_26285 [Bradyrhizobium sp. BWA-3-5]WOH64221.1 hypothetical protein RX331_27075 [Bradyrhizobium sp. BWA-3-5]WOH70144.1 hypothetical protein RX331_38220 [Bradyrhizobium sp. BWA-3-5]
MDLDIAGKPLSGSARELIAHTPLGEGLLREAERHLWQAGLSYHLDEIAEKHLHQAHALAPGHAAILIGLYRFYLYKGRLSESREIARRCITKAARENGLADDWRQVKAADAAFGSHGSILPRFFLFSLKGFAYLQRRLGNLDEGRVATKKLLELDPTDKIGARVLLDVWRGALRLSSWQVSSKMKMVWCGRSRAAVWPASPRGSDS